ncbi:TPR repeat-containing protein [Verrucomicrobium sp. GAS474]|uniref:tetratricopeptide repeat protein n=1 Tax=Verrucomicrobium sp. GAS474 TaxID=1882831 RepID=UPI00087D8F1C|nr:tetratricopeptide repeat protein [Verrucomicrobium sp. GAS474]SDU10902.1 TPR repeat-containing protein [Verrucomicrobium sp. GAS474]
MHFQRTAPLDRLRHSPLLPALLLVLAGCLAYANSFGGPFVFDDSPSIKYNKTITSLFGSLLPVYNHTTGGRPFLNFSFALNYAAGGLDVFGYHLLNLVIHLASGLVLFDLLRRTLLLPRFQDRFHSSASPLAFSAALLWLVHPLQTESVTYLVQRAESLAAGLTLLTLYAFLRGASGPAETARRWENVALISCFLAMGTKETAAAIPLLAFLYDRTFLSGTFSAAWKEHKRFHLSLAATWIFLLLLVLSTHARGGSVGPVQAGVPHTGLYADVTPVTYALTQAKAILLYLRLAFWPSPLILDYGFEKIPTLALAWPYLPGIALLLAGTAWALVRRPALGFLGAAFFLLLAPSSSFIPVQTQTIAEHRFYLPLAVLLVGLVLALHAAVKERKTVLLCAGLLALPLGIVTWERNNDYKTSATLWAVTLAQRPENPRTQASVGDELYTQGDYLGAVIHFNEALRLRPDFAEAHYKLGATLYHMGRLADGISEMATAVALCPIDAQSQSNYGTALAETGHLDQALEHLETAVLLKPDNAAFHYAFGNGLNQRGNVGEAYKEFLAATRLDPDYFEAHNNLGIACYRLGKRDEARAEFETVLRLKPDSTEAKRNLARLRAMSGE